MGIIDYACKLGLPKYVKYLLDKGITVKKTVDSTWSNYRYQDILSSIAIGGSTEVLDLILPLIQINTTRCKNAITKACKFNRNDMVKKLLSIHEMTKPKLLNKFYKKVCKNSNLELAKLFIDMKCNPSFEGALDEVVVNDDVDFMKYLIDNGCVLNLKSKLLHHSVLNLSLKMLRFLLEKGFDCNLEDDKKRTPIFYLFPAQQRLCDKDISKDNDECLKILLEYGCDMERRDIKNKTILYYASHFSFYDLTESLVKHGVKPDSVNIDDVEDPEIASMIFSNVV